MTFERIQEWLGIKWKYDRNSEQLVNDYHVCFSTEQGRRVLNHLIDTIYCSVYEGNKLEECMAFNARRSVIHEILQNIDYAAQPHKYKIEVSKDG